MDFFGLGMGEILLVIIVALIIWGPDKMPEMVRKLSRAMNSLRQTSSDLTSQIRKELEGEEETRSHSPALKPGSTVPEKPDVKNGDKEPAGD